MAKHKFDVQIKEAGIGRLDFYLSCACGWTAVRSSANAGTEALALHFRTRNMVTES